MDTKKSAGKPSSPAACSAVRIARAMELRNELFDIANSFAGEETGYVAVLLHGACNHILWAKQALPNKSSSFGAAAP